MLSWLKRHAVVISLSILVGLLSAAPGVLARISLGQAYKGMSFFYLDDEYTYTARMQEIVDGHWLVGSPYFFEYKNYLPTIPPFGEFFYALPVLALGLPLVDVVLAAKLIFPALLFLLVWLLFKALAGGSAEKPDDWRVTAAASGLVICLAYDQAFLKALLPGSRALLLSLWTRPVNPIIGALIVFLFLSSLWLAMNEGKKFHIVLSGILVALSFSYFFSWGLVLSVACMLVFLQLFNRHWIAVRRLLYVMLAAAIGSVPWFIYMFFALARGGADAAGRNGMFFTHVPTLNLTILVTIAVYALLSAYFILFRKRQLYKENWWIYSAAILFGSLWVYSQQIVTGRTIWPYHFVQYTKPLGIFVVMLLGYKLFSPICPRFWKGLMLVLCLLSLACGTAMAASYRFKLEDYRNIQKYAVVDNWINANTPKDCVILVENDEFLNSQIAAMTHCNVYSYAWSFSGVPLDRVVHNYFVHLRLEGVAPADAEDYMRAHYGDLKSIYFKNWDQLFSTRLDDWLIPKIKQTADEYKIFYGKDFSREIGRYRLDYVVADRVLTAENKDLLKINTDPLKVGDSYVYEFR